MENRERILRKSEKIVQSRDQANVGLVIVESLNCSQDLGHYMPLLLQQHHLVMRIVEMLWNDKKIVRMCPYNQWFHQI